MPDTPAADPQSAPPPGNALSPAASSADQTPTPPPQGDSTPPPAEDPGSAAPHRNGARERIEELVAQNRALREGFEYLRQQIPARPAEASPPADPQPTLTQFDNDVERFTQANNAWLDRQVERRAAAVVDQRLSSRQEEQRLREAAENFSTRAAEFAKGHADYGVVVGNPTLPFNGPLLEAIQASEHGPAIAYHLGLNPDKAARIARLPPLQQAAAVGRLEAEVTKPVPPPRSTNAPPPPTPIGSGTALPKEPAQMTAQEYLDWRLEGKRKR